MGIYRKFRCAASVPQPLPSVSGRHGGEAPFYCDQPAGSLGRRPGNSSGRPFLLCWNEAKNDDSVTPGRHIPGREGCAELRCPHCLGHFWGPAVTFLSPQLWGHLAQSPQGGSGMPLPWGHGKQASARGDCARLHLSEQRSGNNLDVQPPGVSTDTVTSFYPRATVQHMGNARDDIWGRKPV